MAKKTVTAPATKDTGQKPAQTGFLFNPQKQGMFSYILLVFTLLLVLLIRSKFYGIPFERDEGAYSYYGKLLLNGKTPYVDFMEQKFPGLFYFYAMIVGIFGDTVKGMHQGFMIVNMLTIVFLYFASRKLFSPLAGAITAITYAVVSLCPNLSGFTVQGEHGVSLFIALGIFVYSFAYHSNKILHYFLFGLALGTAFMTKTSGMFLVLWGGLVTVSDQFFRGKKFPWKEILIRGIVYSAGVLVVIAFFFVLMSLKHVFNEMIYWAYEIPKGYVSVVKWEEGKKYLEYTFDAVVRDYKFFWVHAFVGLIALLIRPVSLKLKIAMVTLIIFSCMTVVPGYYFYGHYWIQILPGLAMMAALTFHALMTFLQNRSGQSKNSASFNKVPVIYTCAYFLIVLIHLNAHKDYYFNPNYDRIMRDVYGGNPFPETMQIANYINAHSKPEDQIIAMGSEPEIYFYTKKNCPSRHAYFTPLVDGRPEHKDWQAEYIRDVEKAKPRYFVFYNHQISLMVQPGASQYLFEWYNKYVTAHYRMIGLVDMLGGYTSNYVWNEQLKDYKPQSQTVIYIFERKEG